MPARGPTCGVCKHPQREAIETALLAGLPISRIADQWQFKRPTLYKHRDSHIPPEKLEAIEKKAQKFRENSVLTVSEKLGILWTDVLAGIEKARENPDHLKHLAPLIGQGHRNAELQGRVDGTLTPEHAGGGPTVIMNFPALRAADTAPEVYVPQLGKKRSTGLGYGAKPVAAELPAPDDEGPTAA